MSIHKNWERKGNKMKAFEKYFFELNRGRGEMVDTTHG